MDAETRRVLLDLVNGLAPSVEAGFLDRLANEGLVRRVSDEDARRAVRYREAVIEREQLLDRVRETLHPSLPRALLAWLTPLARRRRRAEARALLPQIDLLQAQIQQERPYLSPQRLLEFTTSTHTHTPHGHVLVTDAARQALLRSWHLLPREEWLICGGCAGDRMARWEQAAGAGADEQASDVRSRLALALASRSADSLSRYRSLVALSAQGSWRSPDRLPLLAWFAAFSTESPRSAPTRSEHSWADFENLLRELQAYDVPRGQEGRFAALHLLFSGFPLEEAHQRWRQTAGQLHYDGWSMRAGTDVTAARLVGLRLEGWGIAGRVERIYRELRANGFADGPWLAMAASIVADSNLLPLKEHGGTAPLAGVAETDDVLLRRFIASASGLAGTAEECLVVAAVVASMPGPVSDRLTEFAETRSRLHSTLDDHTACLLAPLLMEAGHCRWFEADRYYWELGCGLHVEEPLSVFRAYRAAGHTWGS